MTRKALLTVAGPIEVTGQAFTTADGVQHPASAQTRWPAERQHQAGLRDIVDASPIAFGHRVVGLRLQVAGDQVAELADLEPIPLEELKAQLYERVRAKRWEVETGGIEVSGQRVATDEKAQAKIAGAVVLLDKDPTRQVVNWEAQPGVWIVLDRPTVEALGVAVGAHVQACFDRCLALWEAIQAAETIEQLQAIDIEGGWPATASE